MEIENEIESMKFEKEIERKDKKERRKLMEAEEEDFGIITTKFKDIEVENEKIIDKNETEWMEIFESKSKLFSKNEEID